VLNELAEAGLITDSHRSKLVGITETGGKKAKELMDKYLMK
jgi:Mn-dependent DtxR family transcriptional regulator